MNRTILITTVALAAFGAVKLFGLVGLIVTAAIVGVIAICQ